MQRLSSNIKSAIAIIAIIFKAAVFALTMDAPCRAASNPPAASNLAANGGFEGAPDWTPNWEWSGSDARMQIVRDKSQAHSGTSALQVTCANGAMTQWRCPNLSLKKNQLYRLSFWYRGTGIRTLFGSVRLIPAPWTTSFERAVHPLLEWEHAEIVGISAGDVPEAAVYFRFEGAGTAWIDDVSLTEISLPPVRPTRTENLLVNSSFEAPPHYRDWIVFGEGRVDGAAAVTGERSFRLEGGATLQSYPLSLKNRCDHTLSVFLKADRPGQATLEMHGDQTTPFAKTVDVGTEWKRYDVTGSSLIARDYQVSISSHGETLWVDDASLTEGAPRPYRPAAPVEAGIQMQGVSRVYRQGEPITARLRAVRYAGPRPARVHWSLVNWRGETEPGGAATLARGEERTVTLRPRLLGMYRAVVQPDGGPATFDVFGVVSPHIGNSKPDSPFGGHFSFSERDREITRKLGVTWDRAHWPPVWTQWRVVEPEKGRWNFPDSDMKTAARDGIQLLGSIMSAPAWAAPESAFLAGDGPYQMAYPDRLDDWRTYVRAIVGRYPQITAWELFNEPNVGIFWQGGDEQYLTLFTEAAKIIREVNPSAKIVAPLFLFEQLQKNGALDLIDAASEHMYANGEDIDERVDQNEAYLKGLRARLDKAGHPKIAIWDTEFGIDDAGSFRRDDPERQGRQGVEYIIKHVVSQRCAGVEKFFPYLLAGNIQGGFAEMDADGAPRAVLLGYSTVIRFCENAVPMGAARPRRPGLRAYLFRAGNEERIFLWMRRTAHPIRLPQTRGVAVYDEMGNALAGSTLLSAMPRIITGTSAAIAAYLSRIDTPR